MVMVVAMRHAFRTPSERKAVHPQEAHPHHLALRMSTWMRPFDYWASSLMIHRDNTLLTHPTTDALSTSLARYSGARALFVATPHRLRCRATRERPWPCSFWTTPASPSGEEASPCCGVPWTQTWCRLWLRRVCCVCWEGTPTRVYKPALLPLSSHASILSYTLFPADTLHQTARSSHNPVCACGPPPGRVK